VTRLDESVTTEFADFRTFAWRTIPRRFLLKEKTRKRKRLFILTRTETTEIRKTKTLKMKKNLTIIFLGLLVLTIVFIVGTPFEFLNSAIDTLATLFCILLISTSFILLFRLARRIDKKLIKWITVGLIILLALPYLWVGIWTAILIGPGYQPKWQDVSIYTNKNGEKVISQWRETSGSIYDYRDRKIIGDFGQFRISFDCDTKKLKGLWTEYNIGRRTTTTIDFEKQLKDETTEKQKATNL